MQVRAIHTVVQRGFGTIECVNKGLPRSRKLLNRTLSLWIYLQQRRKLQCLIFKMLRKRQDIIQWEDSGLAPYAVKNQGNEARIYPEPEHAFRIPFQRDKDRIIHSRAFRRLEYKTQVFIASIGDNYRTRLTHTLEVAALARTVAGNLGLNTYLAESIALAHDLGHAPFGHAGQDQLALLMKNKGGFEHNKQSLRIVRYLENRYPGFPGLNLCIATLKGIMKHGGEYEESDFGSERKEEGPSLEAMITDTCDFIAYNSHDVEDGLESGLISESDLRNTQIWQENYEQVKEDFPHARATQLQRETVRRMLNAMVEDFICTTASNIEKLNIGSLGDITKARKQGFEIIAFSPKMEGRIRELKTFLTENLYKHPEVVALSEFGKEVIEALFNYYENKPFKMPPGYVERIDTEGKYRVICDYIAGMTDRYAEDIAIENGLINPFR